MHIISRTKLQGFWSLHLDAEFDLRRWYLFAKKASWRKPAEVKAAFSTASFLSNYRVVFNIAGNKYRLVVKIAYSPQRVYVRFVGTHQEYDRIDAATI
jgi:mRNA interferase HigB